MPIGNDLDVDEPLNVKCYQERKADTKKLQFIELHVKLNLSLLKLQAIDLQEVLFCSAEHTKLFLMLV